MRWGRASNIVDFLTGEVATPSYPTYVASQKRIHIEEENHATSHASRVLVASNQQVFCRERAAIDTERTELDENPQGEHRELAGIYVACGLAPVLAKQVAQALMAHDALGAHARDELGISDAMSAKPLQAASASAASFAIGAVLPLAIVALSPPEHLIPAVVVASIVFLALLGGLAAKPGGASIGKGGYACHVLERNVDGRRGWDWCYVWHSRLVRAKEDYFARAWLA